MEVNTNKKYEIISTENGFAVRVIETKETVYEYNELDIWDKLIEKRKELKK